METKFWLAFFSHFFIDRKDILMILVFLSFRVYLAPKSEEKRKGEIIPFLSIQNPNTPKTFPIIRQTFESFYHSGAEVYWLSLLHNYIQQSLNSRSAQVQILLTTCRRFAMVRISENSPRWK